MPLAMSTPSYISNSIELKKRLAMIPRQDHRVCLITAIVNSLCTDIPQEEGIAATEAAMKQAGLSHKRISFFFKL
ncbi:hypothetical protein GJ496_011641 [Pomphorhynchus laevis]|nr:hypothetical protein GJ496_011641 [Pomphorhynchus laevis]